MKQDHWEIELHGKSSRFQGVLKCEGPSCEQRRVKLLKFLPNDDGTGIKRICCDTDICDVFENLTAEQRRAMKPFIHNFALVPPLVGVASLGDKLPTPIVNRVPEKQATYSRDTGGDAPKKLSEIQIRYSRADKYAPDFLSLVAAEADCDREQKRDQFETGLETTAFTSDAPNLQLAWFGLPTDQIKNIKVIEGDLLGLVHFKSHNLKVQRRARVYEISIPSELDTAKPAPDTNRCFIYISVEKCRQRTTSMNQDRGSRGGFHEWETDWETSDCWADCRSHLDQKNVTVHYIWRRTAFDRMERALKWFAAAWPGNREFQAQTEIPCIDLQLHQAILGQGASRLEDATRHWKHTENKSKCPQVCRELDHFQMGALEMAMRNTLSLIQGPPGTGKSTTIAAIAYHLVKEKGTKILICAPSNTAVEHICGVVQGMCKELKDLKVFRVKAHTCKHDGPMQLSKIEEADIICCTCIGSGSKKLSEYRFETVIVDESTQGIEPAVLVTLTMGCKRAILVGDEHQLGPTVLDEASAQAGLGQSLFTRLSTRRINKIPHTQLRQQYRMHATLTNFISTCFYDGKLEEPKRFRYAGRANLTKHPLDKPILFWTHDHPQFVSKRHNRGKSYLNPGDVPKVIQIVKKLLDAGAEPKDIGVVTPYRSQRWQLESAMPVNGLEVSTIDGYQGREKDFMVLSCVRSEAAREEERHRYIEEDQADDNRVDETEGEGRTGIGFLTEKRRLNVALSRAKHRLFIIGNATMLKQHSGWDKLVSHTKTNGCAFKGDQFDKLDQVGFTNTSRARNGRTMPRTKNT